MSFIKTALFGPNYKKLKTNLNISITRLKLLEKKKTEIALKARKEIADYIKVNKYDRAKIRVEHIIREDYTVEAMELIEMYCELLSTRFSLIQNKNYVDPSLEEPIASIIWAAERLGDEISEIKTIANILEDKYGEEYAKECRANTNEKVNPRIMDKLLVVVPPNRLIECYMSEIAKTYNVRYVNNNDIIEEQLAKDIPSAPPCLPEFSDTQQNSPQPTQPAPSESFNLANLPSIPNSGHDSEKSGAETDLDELARRFEKLRKR